MAKTDRFGEATHASFDQKVAAASDGGWISILTGRQTVYPSEIGEFRDVAEYVASHQVDYIYFGQAYDPNFTLRLADINIPYQVVFQSEHVMILKAGMP